MCLNKWREDILKSEELNSAVSCGQLCGLKVIWLSDSCSSCQTRSFHPIIENKNISNVDLRLFRSLIVWFYFKRHIESAVKSASGETTFDWQMVSIDKRWTIAQQEDNWFDDFVHFAKSFQWNVSNQSVGFDWIGPCHSSHLCHDSRRTNGVCANVTSTKFKCPSTGECIDGWFRPRIYCVFVECGQTSQRWQTDNTSAVSHFRQHDLRHIEYSFGIDVHYTAIGVRLGVWMEWKSSYITYKSYSASVDSKNGFKMVTPALFTRPSTWTPSKNLVRCSRVVCQLRKSNASILMFGHSFCNVFNAPISNEIA